jgi:hypothetical protein
MLNIKKKIRLNDKIKFISPKSVVCPDEYKGNEIFLVISKDGSIGCGYNNPEEYDYKSSIEQELKDLGYKKEDIEILKNILK